MKTDRAIKRACQDLSSVAFKLKLLFSSVLVSMLTGPNAAMFSNSGTERGHLQQAVLSHKFQKQLDSTLTFEYFVPGDFYKSTAEDAFYLSLMMQFHL